MLSQTKYEEHNGLDNSRKLKSLRLFFSLILSFKNDDDDQSIYLYFSLGLHPLWTFIIERVIIILCLMTAHHMIIPTLCFHIQKAIHVCT